MKFESFRKMVRSICAKNGYAKPDFSKGDGIFSATIHAPEYDSPVIITARENSTRLSVNFNKRVAQIAASEVACCV